MGVAQQVLPGDQIGMERRTLATGEKASSLVKRHTKLSALRDRLHFEFSVDPALANRRVRIVEPVVQAVAEAVGGVLRISRHPECAHLGTSVAPQVAIGILAEPEFRWFLEEQSAFHEGE